MFDMNTRNYEAKITHTNCSGAVSGVGLIGMWLWVLETKGCDMEDSPMTYLDFGIQAALHESVSTEHHVSAKVVRGAGMCSRSRIESSSVLECLCVEAAIRAIDFNIAGRR